MSAERRYPRILIIAVWFGPLPSWFPLWLTSCRFNSDVDWLVATDAEEPDVQIPTNVHFAKMTMDDLAERIAAFSGVPVHFTRPYKACDYRPLFSCLLDLAPGDWEFWGHCDLDMLFGNVRAFLTPRLLEENDRIFGVGHFSVYRNDADTNRFYRRPHPAIDYREILSDPRNRGFDEHLGVNKVWHLHQGRFHEDESVVADIDPHVRSLRRTSIGLVSNSHKQVFGFEPGRVFRLYARGSRLHSEEFMYVHFQKRSFDLSSPPVDCDSVWLTPNGFVPMDGEPITAARIQTLNPAPVVPSGLEILHRSRHAVRAVRRHVRGIIR